MLTMEIKEYLERQINNTKCDLNDYAKDFVKNYKYNDINYLCDTFSEFVDNNISIYYYQQKEFYKNNKDLCNDALLEFYDEKGIIDIIKKGGLEELMYKAATCGEYMHISNQLYDNSYEIKKILSLERMVEDLESGELELYNIEGEEDIEYLLDECMDALNN